jgi:hypothetical protein
MDKNFGRNWANNWANLVTLFAPHNEIEYPVGGRPRFIGQIRSFDIKNILMQKRFFCVPITDENLSIL